MGNGIPGRAKKSIDEVRVEQADDHDLASYAEASSQLERLQVPLIGSFNDENVRLYVAAFDGTGNSLFNDELPTNIGKLARKLGEVSSLNRSVRYDYLEGIGTQDNGIVRVADQAIGASYEPKIEEMYLRFLRQAAEWRRQDPDAEISVIGIGFSRGAVQAAGFARLVHERGIQDPEGGRHRWLPDGSTELVYTRPPLVPPGQVPQVLGLFDPVATGLPSLDDVRLPPSVLSAFQITAEDERRDWFPGMNIVPRGLSQDGRFLNVVVGGAHCDIGGGYKLDGLSIRSGNLMVDYLNAVADAPLLEKRPVPADPAMSVVHRSDDHLPIYTDWRYRLFGGRSHEPATDGSLLCAMAIKCADPEPVDGALAARFEFRRVAIGPVPADRLRVANTGPGQQDAAFEISPAAQREVDLLFERLAQAASRRDSAALGDVAKDYRSTEPGVFWWRSIARREAPSAEFPLALQPVHDPGQPEHQAEVQRPPAQALRL